MKNIYENVYARYKGSAGRSEDMDDFKNLERAGKLTVGNFYQVKHIYMGSCMTDIKLKNVVQNNRQISLNSVAFDFYEITKNNIKEIDIYNDKRFNPYIKEM